MTLAAPLPAAAANECELVGVDPSVNGPLADSYECDQASYPDGVTYDADGDLTLNFTNADSPARSVIGDDDVVVDPSDLGGIALSATASDSITFDSATTATEIESDGVTGALLGVTTVDGNIDIDTEEMDADTATSSGVTRAIFAQSTGTGSIDINTTGDVVGGGFFGSNPADSIGIEALSDSGGITLTTGGSVVGNEGAIRAISTSGNVAVTTNGGVGGGDYGIQAQTGGSGILDITVGGGLTVSQGSQNTVVAGIDATTGTGLMTIDVVGSGFADVQGGGVAAIRANAGGDILINVGTSRRVTSFNARLGDGTNLTAAGDITITNAGQISGGDSAGFFAIRADADTLVINNDGQIGSAFSGGAVDFTGVTNGYTFNNNGTWDITTPAPSVSFIVNSQRFSLLGTGTFNNAGTILFGEVESVIQAQGTTFNGLEGSLLDMQMTLSKVGQTSCDAAVVAGCLDLTGGASTGQTSILITSAAPPLDPAGGLTSEANGDGILLVDVGGGTTATDHFVIDPDSENFLMTSFYGPVITTGGPLFYTLLYNSNTQQHILGTVPTEEGIEYSTFIDEALSIWHVTTDAVVGRQADLRGGATGGGWARLVSERTTRDAAPTLTTHGNSFTYDQGYEIDTRAALFGFDAMTGENYVIGAHGGLISSKTDYDGTGNKNETKGAAAGVYGGWWQDIGVGQLTVDATVNGNFLNLDHKNSFENTDSNIKSLGVRAEAGWKVPVIDGFYVQPLATVAYVVSNIERMKLRRNKLSFQDEESQRAALGLRLGGHFEVESGITARYWLTGRAWEEYAEDGRVEYAATGDPLVIADDLSGSFEEVGFGASLSNREDTLSVFASGGTKFIDDVTNYNVSIGARLRW